MGISCGYSTVSKYGNPRQKVVLFVSVSTVQYNIEKNSF